MIGKGTQIKKNFLHVKEIIIKFKKCKENIKELEYAAISIPEPILDLLR